MACVDAEPATSSQFLRYIGNVERVARSGEWPSVLSTDLLRMMLVVRQFGCTAAAALPDYCTADHSNPAKIKPISFFARRHADASLAKRTAQGHVLEASSQRAIL